MGDGSAIRVCSCLLSYRREILVKRTLAFEKLIELFRATAISAQNQDHEERIGVRRRRQAKHSMFMDCQGNDEVHCQPHSLIVADPYRKKHATKHIMQ